MRSLLFVLILVLMFGISACGPGPKVIRKDVNTTIDLSGRWNDVDSRLVSQAMINDCLDHAWLNDFRTQHGSKKPTIIVGRIRNRTHEHINMQTFIKDLERALINSGKVQFVASAQERGQIREERKDMAKHSSDVSMKGPGQERGADYMLIGTVNTLRDDIGSKAVMYYQTNLELVDMTRNIKVWIGEKKIKKLIKKKKYTW